MTRPYTFITRKQLLPDEKRRYHREYMKDYRAEHSDPRPPRITDADMPEIKRLYTVERLSLDGVGARYGVSGASILYWLRKGGIATRKVGSPKQFNITPKHRQSAARKGVLSQATIAAQEFRQESLIAFPESPQLQADYDAIMAGVRAERGVPWTAGIGSVSDRAGR